MKYKHFLIFHLFIYLVFSNFIFANNFKKINKRPNRHYEDLLLIVGIQRELFFPRPIGEVKTNYGENSFIIYQIVNNEQEKTYKLVMKANGDGDSQTTDLWVYDDKGILMVVYHVSVSKENIRRILNQVRNELKEVEGLKIFIRDNAIVLDGEILLPSDIARIHQVISAYSSVFHIQYTMSPILFSVIAKKMEKEINNPNVKVEVINTRFVLKGVVNSEPEYEAVVAKAKLLLPQFYYIPHVKTPGQFSIKSGGGDLISATTDFSSLPLVSLIQIEKKDEPLKKLIKNTIHFVEIAKGFEKDFGFKWMPSLNTADTKMEFTYTNKPSEDNTAQGLFTTLTGIISNFIPKLNSVLTNNTGRVIQAVSITTMEEQDGIVSKMTKYPYLMEAGTGKAHQFADVGINIKVTPSVEGIEQKIKLGVEITVNQLVATQAVGPPTTTQNQISTWVLLNSKDTAAIAGAVQSINNQAYGNIKPLNDDVIINLSRSKNFSRNRTQFVVFITPEILDSAVEGSSDVMKRFGSN